ncbi:flavin reductase [Parasphaerochaeta coccoides]|nr:flavodoxin [Parasphaerochaeta coccoides]
MFQEIDFHNIELNPFTTIGEDGGYLITAGTGESWNTMTASWGGMGILWARPVFFCFIRPQRHTHIFMDRENGFTGSFFGPEMAGALAWCGSHSGRDSDKAHETGLEPVVIDAPDGSERVTFAQANLVFSCTKAAAMPFVPANFVLKDTVEGFYPTKDYHTLFIGFIDSVLARHG